MNFTNKCQICNAAVKVTPILSEKEIETLLNKIYLGTVSSQNLPLELYLQISSDLENAVYTGFGDTLHKDTKPKDLKTLKSMRDNVHYFSAAKVYQMVRQAEAHKKDRNGMVSQTKFLEKSTGVITEFLGAFLFAEKDHAVQVGKAGSKWNKIIDRKTTTYLEYVTMKDNRVRPAHVYLDGIIRKSDDKFWDTFFPPNGWMCRCKTRSTPKGQDTDLKPFDMEEALYNVPKEFRMNFGKEGIVFPPNHPYFRVPKKDKALARKNFNLPFPHGN